MCSITLRFTYLLLLTCIKMSTQYGLLTRKLKVREIGDCVNVSEGRSKRWTNFHLKRLKVRWTAAQNAATEPTWFSSVIIKCRVHTELPSWRESCASSQKPSMAQIHRSSLRQIYSSEFLVGDLYDAVTIQLSWPASNLKFTNQIKLRFSYETSNKWQIRNQIRNALIAELLQG